MSTKLTLTAIISLIAFIWAGNIFFRAMDGDELWRQLASGFGVLIFGVFFILTVRTVVKARRAARDK
jgi:protein-S-isoprenylcysteine O-methyltransferase Ste14